MRMLYEYVTVNRTSKQSCGKNGIVLAPTSGISTHSSSHGADSKFVDTDHCTVTVITQENHQVTIIHNISQVHISLYVRC